MAHKQIFIDGVKITAKEHALIAACIIHRQRKGLEDILQKSKNTINSQLRLLFKKLRVFSLTDLVMKALQNGYDEKGKYKPKEKARTV